MTNNPYQWANGNYYCPPDAAQLCREEPEMVADHGFPVQLDTTPTPKSFCSVCLKWFDPVEDEGSGNRPKEGHTHEHHAGNGGDADTGGDTG
ncbi:hypothetical protein SEA_RIZWANA_78 [Arthrobacter phage Rizwana]|nr:hypothetical protein SEA_RIZWANA_78 [Arthrobacter phage Rizwana]